MKRLIILTLIAMLIPAVSAEAQWHLPRRPKAARVEEANETERPRLKRPDGTPVQYAQQQLPASFSVPAGTRVLMTLISPLHTTSATTGSGIYLEVAYPVVINSQVLIPAGSKVQGTVVGQRRPGRIKGRAQFLLTFEQLILPDNRVLPIEGALVSVPGSSRNRRLDKEGTIEPVDQIDRDVITIAGGAGVGALAGLARLSPAPGPGAAIGAGLGIGYVLFSRGDEISLREGTNLEMVLRKPILEGDAAQHQPDHQQREGLAGIPNK